MKSLLREFNDLKIYIKKQNCILIENYNKLLQISENKILIDNIIIVGSKFYIKELNSYQIQIEGDLSEISFV